MNLGEATVSRALKENLGTAYDHLILVGWPENTGTRTELPLSHALLHDPLIPH